ncbi:MAG: hypothetical protein JSS87_12820 [Acidobacteria bacterium]|nr:hypothetical protein [Acidobacteriota bacterium]
MNDEYDLKPEILHKFVSRLNRSADFTELAFAFGGFVLGFPASFVLLNTVLRGYIPGSVLLVALLVGTLLGLAWGRSRALGIRVQAQTLLMQMSMEKTLRLIAHRLREG